MPQYKIITDMETGEQTMENMWLPIYLPSMREYVLSLDIVREPARSTKTKEYIDDLRWSKPNDR